MASSASGEVLYLTDEEQPPNSLLSQPAATASGVEQPDSGGRIDLTGEGSREGYPTFFVSSVVWTTEAQGDAMSDSNVVAKAPSNKRACEGAASGRPPKVPLCANQSSVVIDLTGKQPAAAASSVVRTPEPQGGAMSDSKAGAGSKCTNANGASIQASQGGLSVVGIVTQALANLKTFPAASDRQLFPDNDQACAVSVNGRTLVKDLQARSSAQGDAATFGGNDAERILAVVTPISIHACFCLLALQGVGPEMLQSQAQQMILGACCEYRCPNDDKGLWFAVMLLCLFFHGMASLRAKSAVVDGNFIASFASQMAAAYDQDSQLGWGRLELTQEQHCDRVGHLFKSEQDTAGVVGSAMRLYELITRDGCSEGKGNQRPRSLLDGTVASDARMTSQALLWLAKGQWRQQTLALKVSTFVIMGDEHGLAQFLASDVEAIPRMETSDAAKRMFYGLVRGVEEASLLSMCEACPALGRLVKKCKKKLAAGKWVLVEGGDRILPCRQRDDAGRYRWRLGRAGTTVCAIEGCHNPVSVFFGQGPQVGKDSATLLCAAHGRQRWNEEVNATMLLISVA